MSYANQCSSAVRFLESMESRCEEIINNGGHFSNSMDRAKEFDRRKIELETMDAWERYKEGESIVELAKKIGITTVSLRRRFKNRRLKK